MTFPPDAASFAGSPSTPIVVVTPSALLPILEPPMTAASRGLGGLPTGWVARAPIVALSSPAFALGAGELYLLMALA
jgi:hypothetical protein